MLQTGLAEQATNVGAPVLPFSIQGRNKDSICVDLKCSLAEFLGTVASAQIEDLKSRFFQGQLHNSIANYVNVVPDYTDDDSPLINAPPSPPVKLERNRTQPSVVACQDARKQLA